jgi:DMSO/TMAO reductase YedYZ molybdopterin-dependent catalytic subunit
MRYWWVNQNQTYRHEVAGGYLWSPKRNADGGRHPAWHPQTLLAYGMNGAELPIRHGAPVRLKMPRQLGYKNVKYLQRITVTDTVKNIGKGVGGASVEDGYSWYAGI